MASPPSSGPPRRLDPSSGSRQPASSAADRPSGPRPEVGSEADAPPVSDPPAAPSPGDAVGRQALRRALPSTPSDLAGYRQALAATLGALGRQREGLARPARALAEGALARAPLEGGDPLALAALAADLLGSFDRCVLALGRRLGRVARDPSTPVAVDDLWRLSELILLGARAGDELAAALELIGGGPGAPVGDPRPAPSAAAREAVERALEEVRATLDRATDALGGA